MYIQLYPIGVEETPNTYTVPWKRFLRKTFMLIQVYVAEAEGIPEYGTTTTLGKRLVAVKFLLPEANEKEK